jgi:imidazole glycerol-phosphate synthase subunit HisH
MRFGLIDYGSGNLRSVAKAIDAVGGQVRVHTTPSGLEHEDVLVLPGVGAFGDCVAQLRARELWEPIAAWLREGRPFLGICLGYQLLFETSEESPGTAGLGHFAGSVRRLRSEMVKVPHIGWNTIEASPPGAMLWQGLPPQPHFYFVHSYVPRPTDPAIVAAHCTYGETFAAAVTAPGPLLATQFHPEKSQRAGLTLLRNFVASVGTRVLA